MSALAWDFSDTEAGIVAWLKEHTQTGPNAWARVIGTRKELSAVAEEAQVAPAVYVVYRGFRVLEANEFEARLRHTWFVVLAVATAASQREAAPINDLAGRHLAQLFALHGQRMPGTTSPLIPATPPAPHYSPAKFAYFPLAFTHESYSCK